ncbi:MAG: outer membrane protein transport protein, partial [Bacteroidetes bacterium]|nr:outer membrane protein transport protein [Bacteroidota bacterium]
LLLIVLVTACASLTAGGFQLNLQGQKQSGMGHAGTGLCLDNASILFNPGALSFLDSLRGIYIGASFIMPRTTYLDYQSRYVAHPVKHVGTPITLYAVYKFKNSAKWNCGFGIYNPFGSKVQWEDNWKGQFLIREIDLKTFFIQPTVSYKVNDKLGIGAGFVYATGSFSLRKGVPLQDSSGTYGEASLAGKASGYGFNAGIYFKANDKFSIGIDYRSEVTVDVNSGSADFVTPSSLAYKFPNTTFNTQLRLPQMATLGFGYTPNDKLKFALDINYVGWKSYDSLIIDFAENTDALKDIHSARMYKDSYIFRIGGQYQLTNKWTVRAGTYYDMSPVQDGYLTPETPDADKLGVTLGASYHITKKLHLDMSLLYIEGKQRTDTNLETGFTGTYKTKAVVPGVSLEYVF